MPPQESYELWKQQRARPDVPADFADRVMAALPDEEATGLGFGSQGWIAHWFSFPLGKVGICALGCLALLLRVGSVIALFLELAGKVEGAS
jgi:hypothetical protein